MSDADTHTDEYPFALTYGDTDLDSESHFVTGTYTNIESNYDPNTGTLVVTFNIANGTSPHYFSRTNSDLLREAGVIV